MSNGFDYKSRVFLVLWIVNFLLTFATSLIPTSRNYLTKMLLGGDETATMEALGIIASIGYAATTLGYFAGAFAADGLGKRNVVVVSFVILATGCGLFVAAPNLSFVFLASFVELFAAGFCSPAIAALVASCSEQNSRGTAYGIFNLSWVSAGIAGPLLSGVLAQFVTLHTPFVLAALVGIVGLVLAFLLEGKKTERQRSDRNNSVEKAVPKQDLALRRVVLIFGVTNLLNGLLNGFINPVISGMLMFKLGAAPAVYGLILSLSSSLITGIVQLPGGKFADRFGRKPLTLIGFLGVPLVLLLGFSRSLLDFSVILGGISAVGNISGPAISAWLMDLIPEHRRARVSGITQTLNGVGLTVGPYGGYYVWNSTKPDAVPPCGIAALFFIASLPFYLMLNEPNKRSSSYDNDDDDLGLTDSQPEAGSLSEKTT